METQDLVFALRLALISRNRLTLFAWLAVLGALTAACGLLLFAAGNRYEDGSEPRPLPWEPRHWRWEPDRPRELLERAGRMERGLGLFLAGAALLGVGLYPFVTAPR